MRPRARPYSFVSVWRAPVPRELLWRRMEEMIDRDDPVLWWGSVRVVARRADALDLEAVSALGYRLRFTVDELSLQPMDVMTLRSRGDLDGSARFTFLADGPENSRLRIEWNVIATRAWMRWTDPVLRPAFLAAHWLIMRHGERRLKDWLIGQV